MSRSRRYDEPKMPTRPRATTTPITMSIVRSGTSPSHMTARMPTTQIMAVPRSDWVRYMSAMGAMMKMRARTMVARLSSPARQSTTRRTATRMKAILQNSEGCSPTGPI